MRLTRWSLALQPYTFEIYHRKGRDNANADALSRLSGKVKTDQCFTLEIEGGSNVTDKLADQVELANHLIKNGTDQSQYRKGNSKAVQ